MGKAAWKIASKLAPKLNDHQWQLIEEWNAILDEKSIEDYYKKVMRWEKCSWDEAVELCKTNLTYSIGRKMCSPAVIEMLKVPDGSGIQKFRSWLTPEELEFFDNNDEWPKDPKGYSIIHRKMMKKQKKRLKIEG